MAQLSSQAITERCVYGKQMITPFVDKKVVVNGKSYGLSAASYDVRIASDLVLGPSPAVYMKEMCDVMLAGSYGELADFRTKLANLPPMRALANTVEDFFMPYDVAGYVVDKSSFARVFVTAFNTLLDPGFVGNLTLELVNLGSDVVEMKVGDPICQITFHFLDRPTDRPYSGKFQHQTAMPHGPRYEKTDGTWSEPNLSS